MMHPYFIWYSDPSRFGEKINCERVLKTANFCFNSIKILNLRIKECHALFAARPEKRNCQRKTLIYGYFEVAVLVTMIK